MNTNFKKVSKCTIENAKNFIFYIIKTYYTTHLILTCHIRFRKPDETYNSNQKSNKYAYKYKISKPQEPYIPINRIGSCYHQCISGELDVLTVILPEIR